MSKRSRSRSRSRSVSPKGNNHKTKKNKSGNIISLHESIDPHPYQYFNENKDTLEIGDIIEWNTNNQEGYRKYIVDKDLKEMNEFEGGRRRKRRTRRKR